MKIIIMMFAALLMAGTIRAGAQDTGLTSFSTLESMVLSDFNQQNATVEIPRKPAPVHSRDGAFSGEPGAGLRFLELKPFNTKTSVKWGPVFKDIINHQAPGDNNSFDDDVTVAHETTHGINSYIRNKLAGGKGNGFYMGENRAVTMPEPAMKKSQVAPFVPPSLRGSRYSMYVTGQTAWDSTPLYLFDEWACYNNGGAVAVDQARRGLWTSGWRDGVAGEIEFLAYGLATAMAIQKHDPSYFERNPQFLELTAFNAKRTMESFIPGSQMPEFKWDKQDKYYNALKTSPDAEPLRSYARELFGAEWTKSTLGF